MTQGVRKSEAADAGSHPYCYRRRADHAAGYLYLPGIE